jgi:putative ABC transport system permease protein
VLSSLWQDVRTALRALIKAPAFAAVTLLTLAVAIGATTAIYSVVHAVLLSPLPYPDADRIVTVAARTHPGAGGAGEAPFSDRGFWHFVNNGRAWEKFGGYVGRPVQMPLTGEGEPLQLEVSLMNVGAFEVIGMQPSLGRLPSPEEDIPDAPRVVVISRELWTNLFGADRAILGRSIELNAIAHEVIGVMPADYDFPRPGIDAWLPYRLNPASPNFGGHGISGIARLTPDATLASAETDAKSLIGRFREVGYDDSWFQTIFTGEASVKTLKDGIVGDARTPILILFGTVGFVLLIACSNVANLFLVRAENRTRDTAVRTALGSGRGRLIQFVLTESVLLGLLGGLAGVLLAYFGTRLLVAAAPASVPRLHEIGIRGSVLAFTTAVSVIAGLLFGLVPALRSGSPRMLLALRDGGRGSSTGSGHNRVRNTLVVTQVALALVLVVGSGLLVRSFRSLLEVDPGFATSGVLTLRLSPPAASYANGPPVVQFYDQLLERIRATPGVTAAGAIDALPLTGGGAILTTVIDDFPPAEGEFPPVFLIRRVTPGYMETMGIDLVEGRFFTTDDHNLRMGSLLISKSLKDQYWPNSSALGKRFNVAGAPGRVVGVVEDVHDASLEVAPEQFIYRAMLDSVGGGVRAMTIAVRTQAPPLELAQSMRSIIQSMDPNLPITDIRSMETVLGDSMSRTTFTMSLLLLAAGIALFLGAIGIYGVISYVVSNRTTEIGVRQALGADAGRIRGSVIGQGMTLAAIGVAIGLALTLAMGKAIATLLYDVKPYDAITLAGGVAVFLAVAALASTIPAFRASRIPPAIAIRGD